MMVGRTARWRHVVVGLAVGVVALLAGTGVLGEAERVDEVRQLQVTIEPWPEAGPDAVRVTEVIDQWFPDGKHGPELVVPDDFGVPEQVTASSPDAPDAVAASPALQATRIRIGDPLTTISGDHRYRLSYVLPEARLSTGRLGIDAVGAQSAIPIGNVSITVTGLELDLDGAQCSTGGRGGSGGCSLVAVEGGYRTTIDQLDREEGVTLGADITGRTTAAAPGVLDPPAPPTTHRVRNALLALVLGLAAGGGVFARVRRIGSNLVAGSGAADAAFAGPPPASLGASDPLAPSGGAEGAARGPERLLSDAQLAELATIEFAPPPGLEPWQGALLLSERLGDPLVTDFFSGAAGSGLLDIGRQGELVVTLRPGPAYASADPFTRDVLDRLFQGRPEVELGQYDEDFGAAWSKVATAQVAWAASSGWWRGPLPTARPFGGQDLFKLLPVVVFLLILGGSVLSITGLAHGLLGLALLALGVPAAVARMVYARLLPGRTAEGSAHALRVESFRRFLVESEGQHVTWAWEHGLLRQYSAWAVALGAADAWQRAMVAAGVPPAELAETGPMVTYGMAHTFTTSHSAPAPSSGSGGSSWSGGGGGFSGGSVGGGGGGGSHGSW